MNTFLLPMINIAFMFLLVVGSVAEATELKVLSGVAIQPVMQDLAPKFENVTGHKLTMTFDGLGGVLKRVKAGEIADVVIVPQQGIERLLKDADTAAGDVTEIARTGVGVAVRRGGPKPDISSPEALKRTLLAAKSVAYSNPAGGGASGNHFAKVLEGLGIANEMKPKTVFPKAPGGAPVALLVANGEAEIGVHQIQELLQIPGVEIVGPLPADLQDTIVFSAAIMTGSKNAEAGKALIHFLRTAEAIAVIKAKGMEPAGP